MDESEQVSAPADGRVPDPSMTPVAAAPGDAEDAVTRARRRILRLDLTVLVFVGILLAGALVAGGAAVYDRLYSPAAFVTRYLDLLSQGRAADALNVPGVRIDSAALDAAGLTTDANEALLRQAALAPLTDIKVVDSVTSGDVTAVTVSYKASGHAGQTTFRVSQAGMIGVVPSWRFQTSPLAVIDLTVRGAMQFDVNGFEIDKRQVLAAGVDADPLAAVPLLVFAPGLYSITVDTSLSTSPGVAVLSDKPLAEIPVSIQTEPTEKFVDVVQNLVDNFLTDCATQDVLQPTGCPFGFTVQNRIMAAPTWSISEQPVVTLEPDGADWRIKRTQAVAHIVVDIQSIFDGSVRHVDEDVPFFIDGDITVMPDGTASIQVSSAD